MFLHPFIVDKKFLQSQLTNARRGIVESHFLKSIFTILLITENSRNLCSPFSESYVQSFFNNKIIYSNIISSIMMGCEENTREKTWRRKKLENWRRLKLFFVNFWSKNCRLWITSIIHQYFFSNTISLVSSLERPLSKFEFS